METHRNRTSHEDDSKDDNYTGNEPYKKIGIMLERKKISQEFNLTGR